jgi:hypothetical protein
MPTEYIKRTAAAVKKARGEGEPITDEDRDRALLTRDLDKTKPSTTGRSYGYEVPSTGGSGLAPQQSPGQNVPIYDAQGNLKRVEHESAPLFQFGPATESSDPYTRQQALASKARYDAEKAAQMEYRGAPPPVPKEGDPNFIGPPKSLEGDFTQRPVGQPEQAGGGGVGGYGGGAGGGAATSQDPYDLANVIRGQIEHPDTSVMDAKAREGQAYSARGDALQKAHEQASKGLALDESIGRVREGGRQMRMEHAQLDVDTLVRNAASEQVDPKKYWKDQSTIGKVGKLLALAMGGFVQGFKGLSHNPIQTVIDGEIQANIDAQKTAIAGKWKQAEAADHALGRLHQQLGDERAAELAMQAQGYKSVQENLAGLAAKTTSDVEKAHAETEGAILKEKQQDKLIQLAERLEQVRRARKGVGGGSAFAPGEGIIDEEHIVRGADGELYFAPKNEVKDIQQGMENADAARGAIKTARTLVESGWSRVPLAADHAQLKSAAMDIILEGRKKGVKMSDRELHALTQIMGDVSDITTPYATKQRLLDNAQELMDGAIRRSLSGLHRVEFTGETRDKKGELQQTGRLLPRQQQSLKKAGQ